MIRFKTRPLREPRRMLPALSHMPLRVAAIVVRAFRPWSGQTFDCAGLRRASGTDAGFVHTVNRRYRPSRQREFEIR